MAGDQDSIRGQLAFSGNRRPAALDWILFVKHPGDQL